MKKILFILFPIWCHAQTSFTLTENTNQLIRQGAGAHRWINQNAPNGTINIPVQGSPEPSMDYYYRVTMLDLFVNRGAGAGDSAFDFTFYRARMTEATSNRQRVRWRWMAICTDCGDRVTYSSALSYFPFFLKNLMPNAWISTASGSSNWIPDYRDPDWIRWVGKVHQGIRAYNDTAVVNGYALKNVLRIIDLGMFGNYGEWHHGNVVSSDVSTDFPANTFPTDAQLDTIIRRQIWPYYGAYSAMQYVTPVAILDANYLQNTRISAAVTQFYLNMPDSASFINDHIFSPTDYSFQDPPYFENNNRVGLDLYKILNRWKSSPLGGEPPGGTTNPADFGAGTTEVAKYKYSWFGNGNMPYTSNSTAGNNFRAASAAAGWRMVMTSGTMTTTLTAGGNFNITMNYQNKGVAPIYDNWTVKYQLRNSSDVVLQEWTSSFVPRLFQPSGSATTFNENFTLSAIAAGSTYKLTVIGVDPTGYMVPLVFNNTNTRLTDGGYVLRTGITVNAAVTTLPYNTRTPAVQIRQGRAF